MANLQGDIIAIVNTSNAAVVEYVYDAWGNVLSISGTMATTLGTLNPLTYRGYVYDYETNLYYLQSRYYSPEWGRFLNADALVATGQGMLGNNMFVYCNNNPVMFTDSTGTRVDIWPVLFDDHDPGYIHRAVQAHIVASGLFQKELYLPGIGRVDIYDPETNEIWEIKHGGSTIDMQNERMRSAELQAMKYVHGADIPLQLGHAGAFTGEFVLNCGSISYLVTYDTPAQGVILYYVQEMKNYEPEASVVYVPLPQRNKNSIEIILEGIGMGIALSFVGGVNGGVFDPLSEAAFGY